MNVGRDVQAEQFGDRRARPVAAVDDDQPVRVLAADGLHKLLGHPTKLFRLHLVVGLVEQVEADMAVGHALVTIGKNRPVVRAELSRLALGPEIRRLGRSDLAEAGGDVEIEQQVNAMLLAELDGPIDLPEDRLLEVPRIVEIGPVVVVECQAKEVEAQVSHVGEVALIEQFFFLRQSR